jgi:hypothetical protein
MNLRREFEKRIERKRQEIVDLEKNIGEAKAYMQALQDSIKIFSRETESEEDTETVLRPGSMLAAARDAIKKAGKPLHIVELLKALGKEPAKANRLSLSGSLSGYVRSGSIFTRPRPNTFGLIEFTKDLGGISQKEPPDDFGVTNKTELKDDAIPF